MLFGQHCDGEVPRNLNLIFLRPFEHGFKQKIGTLMFKNQNDGATLRLFKEWRMTPCIVDQGEVVKLGVEDIPCSRRAHC